MAKRVRRSRKKRFHNTRERVEHQKQLANSMVKRIRQSQKKQCAEGDCFFGDRISLFPDEILAYILAFLSLKEAIATSILSRRWKDAWKFIPRLHFDVRERFSMLPLLRNNKLQIEIERIKYVKWVNQVLELHKLQSFEECRIAFDLDESFKSDIDKWIHSTFSSRLQRLELDFSNGICSSCPMKQYTFPHEMFRFQSIRVLRLKRVNVTGEFLECLLSSCPVLEQLSIEGSHKLTNLKVVGPSLVLKYLEISSCRSMNSIQICNVNLVSFIYKGNHISPQLENLPLLTDLSIGVCLPPASLEGFFPKLSCCFSQLETLTLEFCYSEVSFCTHMMYLLYEPQGVGEIVEALRNNLKKFQKFDVSPQLTNLKKLVLSYYSSKDACLLGYTCLIEASPNLQKFVYQAKWCAPIISFRKLKNAEKSPHQHLEEVTLAGYYGGTCDLELLNYFLENAVGLKRIIINTQDQFLFDCPKDEETIEEEKAALCRAKQQLHRIVPLGIELIIY